jgi:hypothetical protein
MRQDDALEAHKKPADTPSNPNQIYAEAWLGRKWAIGLGMSASARPNLWRARHVAAAGPQRLIPPREEAPKAKGLRPQPPASAIPSSAIGRFIKATHLDPCNSNEAGGEVDGTRDRVPL